MSTPATADAAKPRFTFAPLPETRRGYGIHLNVIPKENRIVYTNGRVVILRSLTNPADTLTFTEHKHKVNVAVLSPSGYWVASGDEGGNVMIWSYPQMKVKNTFPIGKSVLDLDWDESSTRIVAVGDGAQLKAKVFSWDSGNNLGEISMHSHAILACSYRKHRPFRIVTGSEDLTVNIYEGPPFKYTSSYKGHARYPNQVKYSPDGNFYASAGADSKIVLFEGKTGEVVREIEPKEDGHKGAIYSFAWSPDSKQILTVSADKTAKIWNIQEGTVTTTFQLGNDTLDQQVGALWHNDFLITVSLSGAINYLDVANPSKPKRVLHGHQSTIQSISLDRKNNVFYTSSLTGEIGRWDFATGDCKWFTGKGHDGKVITGVSVSADGSSVFSVALDDKIRVNDANGVVNSDATDLGGQPVAIAASPVDNKLVVVALAQDKLAVVRNGSVVHTSALSYRPNTVNFSVDGAQIVVGGKDKKVHLYDVKGDTLVAAGEITTHDKPLTSARFSPNHQYVVSSDGEASVYFHDAASPFAVKNKSGWRFHQALVTDIDVNAAGTKAVTSSNDTHLIVWNDIKAFNGSDRVKINAAHTGGAEAARWWDDKTVISYGADRCIKVWDV